LGNAAKFTEEGSIALRIGPLGDEIEHEGRRGGEVAFEVKDTGPGIGPDLREELFEPFVQGSGIKKRSGTGLGLTISRRYARMLGGELSLESEVGEGSCFRLVLPGWVEDE